MVHKGDMKILAQMLKNIESQYGKVEFSASSCCSTYNIVDELKEEGDWEVLRKYSGFEFDSAPKGLARTKYENLLYLERPGCNLCMGNQEKAEPGDTVMATSTRLFRVVLLRILVRKRGVSIVLYTSSCIINRFRKNSYYGRI